MEWHPDDSTQARHITALLNAHAPSHHKCKTIDKATCKCVNGARECEPLRQPTSRAGLSEITSRSLMTWRTRVENSSLSMPVSLDDSACVNTPYIYGLDIRCRKSCNKMILGCQTHQECSRLDASSSASHAVRPWHAKTAFERIKGPVANVPAHMESPSRKQTSRSLYRGPITPWHGLDVAAPRLLSPCDLEMKITVHQAARLHSWGSHNAS